MTLSLSLNVRVERRSAGSEGGGGEGTEKYSFAQLKEICKRVNFSYFLQLGAEMYERVGQQCRNRLHNFYTALCTTYFVY